MEEPVSEPAAGYTALIKELLASFLNNSRSIGKLCPQQN